MNLDLPKHIYLIGIGGIGMSALARYFNAKGKNVCGYDKVQSSTCKQLENEGIKIHYNDGAENIPQIIQNATYNEILVIYTPAIPKQNIELNFFSDKGFKLYKRAEVLGMISKQSYTIAVAGTHGKTTTSSMIGMVLEKSGHDPTLVVGGLVSNLNTNVKLGLGNTIVVEADEFDRSFLALNPTIALVTNLEMEHTDCYEDLDDLENAFLQFCKSVPFYGEVILCADSESLMNIMPKIKKPVVTYGLSNNADYCAKNINYNKNKSEYNLFHKQKNLGRININVPGKHNVLNSLAAIALGIEIDIPLKQLKIGINSYKGVRRRFEEKKNNRDVFVVDDYAHHPTEVNATIMAAKNGWNKKIVSVFQPHLFSRTKYFYKDFAISLNESDKNIILPIYPAREKPLKNVTSALIQRELEKLGHMNSYDCSNRNKIPDMVNKIVMEDDIIIVMGAGDIYQSIELI